jgi:microcystin-dependent protein
MSEAYIGQIIPFAGNYAIQGWARCDGQLLPIQQYTALFAVIGNAYGGDGVTNFALPDLRARVPLHSGQGPGRSNRPLGSAGGQESVTLQAAQMPPHGHTVAAYAQEGAARGPANAFLANTAGAYSLTSDGTTLNAGAVAPAGGG